MALNTYTGGSVGGVNGAPVSDDDSHTAPVRVGPSLVAVSMRADDGYLYNGVYLTCPTNYQLSADGLTWATGITLTQVGEVNVNHYIRKTATLAASEEAQVSWEYASREVGNYPPSAFTPTVSAITASTATVTFSTTDPDGDPLTYKVAVTTSATPPADWSLYSDETSPYSAVGLTEATNYYAHVQASDGSLTTEGTSNVFTTGSAATTDTFYVTDVARVDYTNSNFTTCRNATDGNASNNDLASDNWFPLVNYSAPNYFIYRGFLFFDTSALPDGATVTAAALKIRYSGTVTGSPSVVLQQSTVVSNTTVANADYDAFTGGELSARVSPTANTWMTFTLNATGRATISKTGFTKFCLREAQDYDNSWSAAKYGNIRTLDDATYKPYLEVTYTT